METIQEETYNTLLIKYSKELARRYCDVIVSSVFEGLHKVWHSDSLTGIEGVTVSQSSENSKDDVCKEYIYQLVGEYLTVCNPDDLTKSIQDGTIEWWDTAAFKTFKDAAIADIKMQTEGVKIEKCDLKCRNTLCRSDKCVFYLQQTRSGDEGMTAFVICTKCQTRYRLG